MSGAKRPRRVRRIAVVTGTRAEYGLLRSTIAAIRDHPALRLQVVVTGMHLLRKFGHTVDDIRRDGWPIDARVRMQAGDDDPVDQAAGLARGVAGIARFCVAARTDVVLVLGDRIEAMAGALAAVTTGRLLAHIHGGDIAPGDFDDSLRDAITKLAHVHLAATPAAARRLVRMGEPPDRVHVVGAPGLDDIVALRARRPRGAPRRSGTALVLQHPTGRPATRERRTMGAILRAVQAVGLSRIVIYPNTDRGHKGVIDAIKSHRSRSSESDVIVVPSLGRTAYVQRLIDADVLVGNSSSGIIEAPAAGTPVVNVGLRQAGRERGGAAILDADESYTSIVAALRAALRQRPISRRARAYGTGGAAGRIVQVLAAVPLTERFRRKCTRRDQSRRT
ncbi:MAG: UDP-N-acetylglucosamine 2-epimerase [Phycisphaerae bacterium]